MKAGDAMLAVVEIWLEGRTGRGLMLRKESDTETLEVVINCNTP